MIQMKTDAEIAKMRVAGLVVADTLAVLTAAVAPGITTADLDAIAETSIRDAGAVPSFKGYHGFPATICTSVNN
ncbi:MAG: M24 family metallopeptidase, partial [Mycobacterium leprae]